MLRLQVNGDGTALYLGAEPTPSADVARCLRELTGSLRFRATGGEPFTLRSMPYQVREAPQDEAEHPNLEVMEKVYP